MSAQTSGPDSAPVDAVASGSEPGMSGPELTVNVPLLRKAVEWAEAEAARGADGRWEQMFVQSDKDCGTCYCMAGWVAAQDTETGDPYDVPSGDPIQHAADRLGIPSSRDEWSPLFDANNTIADVRRIAESLAGERL